MVEFRDVVCEGLPLVKGVAVSTDHRGGRAIELW
jgi:hypothetical protein